MKPVVKMNKSRNNDWQYEEQMRNQRKQERAKRDARRNGREGKRILADAI